MSSNEYRTSPRTINPSFKKDTSRRKRAVGSERGRQRSKVEKNEKKVGGAVGKKSRIEEAEQEK